MKRNYLIIASLIILLGFITMCSLPTIRINLKYARLRPQQEKLAEELGIKIQDYPNERSFPVGYFDTILEPGMTIYEVHKIVKGYVGVFRCFNDSAEHYYYYSLEEDKEIDFFIFFDTERNFMELKSIEPLNNKTVSSGGPVACFPGLLNE
jgi:hypothetical protein